ncbi:hypothetical protein [Chromobacterium sphagni]|uniref:Uncharacterized protein n=1 Tax=Chromobacterium sphagni TaxID=1903179 RepID=A0A1S1WXX3_9NEIS|nr:hypothetical protein [Chromobacterium sphagni]OHX12147.1 hypothetical protein BI347_00530 [Chromobacterium sphagni]OHX21769.1 hypothetical protein BI344_04485 [Chromobacterium sphagni]
MMRIVFAGLLLAASQVQAAPASQPSLPPALLLSVERDGEPLRQLPLCLAADGSFHAARRQDGAELDAQGRLQAPRGHAYPLVNLQLSWRDDAGAQRLDSQLALEDGRQLLGGLQQLVYPYGKAPGVEPQRSSLTFYLERQAACPPPGPDKAKE